VYGNTFYDSNSSQDFKFYTGAHETGHSLGLGHLYDIPLPPGATADPRRGVSNPGALMWPFAYGFQNPTAPLSFVAPQQPDINLLNQVYP